MKTIYTILFFLFFLLFNQLFSQTIINTDITSDRVFTTSGSPYLIQGGITVQGCTLTVQSGVTVNLTEGYLNISGYGHSAVISGNNVTFLANSSNSYIYYYGDGTYYAEGTLSNCTFTNVYIDCRDYSKPTISNSVFTNVTNTGTGISASNVHCTPTFTGNTISGYQYPIMIGSGALPNISGNNVTGCLFQGIGLTGEFYSNYTLATGYKYGINGALTIGGGCTFTIPSGLTVDMNAGYIYVSTYSPNVLYNQETARLNATNVIFTVQTGSTNYIYYIGANANYTDYYAEGTLSSCTFTNVYIDCEDYSKPTISNSTFTNVTNDGTGLTANKIHSTPTFTGNTISGYQYPIMISNGALPNISGNNITGCLFQGIGLSGAFYSNYTLATGYKYGINGALTIGGGCTFTIPSGLTVDMNAGYIYVSTYSPNVLYNQETARLNATNVIFTVQTGSTNYIYYIGANANYTDYYAEGTLSSCTFTNVYIDCEDYSKPTISNSTFTNVTNDGTGLTANKIHSTPTFTGNTISGYQYPIMISNGALPNISGNNITGCLFQGIGLSGAFYSNYTLATGYMYGIYSSLTIGGGCTFTIPSGLTVDLNAGYIDVSTYNPNILYNHETAKLNAMNVIFTVQTGNSSLIQYSGANANYTDYFAEGTLSSCTFTNVYIDCEDYSKPTISNSTFTNVTNDGTGLTANKIHSTPTFTGNTISGYQYPIMISNGALPNISGNNITGCLFHGIGLSGAFYSNYTLATGYMYGIYSSLTIGGGCTFTIPSGLTVDLNAGYIDVSTYNPNILYNHETAKLNATNVIFTVQTGNSSLIQYSGANANYTDYFAEGTLSSCTFTNVYIDCEDYSKPTISNSTFTNVTNDGTGLTANKIHSTPTFTGNTISGYQYPIMISNGALPNISGNNITGCLFHGIGLSGAFYSNYTLATGYMYGIYSSLTIGGGCTFTIPSGLTVDLNAGYIDVSTYNPNILYNHETAKLNATNVIFTVQTGNSSLIQYSGANANYTDYFAEGTLSSCTFTNVYIDCEDYSKPTISRSTFRDGQYGVYVISGGNPMVSPFNNFINITDIALKNEGTNTINAINNYWGDITGPSHSSNQSGQGAVVTGDVSLHPFLKWEVKWDNDFGITEILAPINTISRNSSVVPKAIITNFGLLANSAQVRFTIGNTYQEYTQVTLEPLSSDTISFPIWTADMTGTFLTSCKTFLSGDQEPGNDSLNGTITVLPTGQEPVILSITPTRGGSGGAVTIDINGLNFRPGAKVLLSRSGFPDLYSDSIYTNIIDPNNMRVIFDLNNCTTGIYDLTVQNTDNTSTTFYSGFIIEPTRNELSVNITGDNQIRAGQNQSYIIRFSNLGNVDVLGGYLVIDGIPNSAYWSLSLGLDYFPSIPNVDSASLAAVPDYYNLNNEISIPLLLPRLRASSTGELLLTLNVPVGTSPFAVRVRIADLEFSLDTLSLIQSFLSSYKINTGQGLEWDNPQDQCYAAIAELVIETLIGIIPAVDCIQSGIDQLSSTYFLYFELQGSSEEEQILSWNKWHAGLIMNILNCLGEFVDPWQIIDVCQAIYGVINTINTCSSLYNTEYENQFQIQPVWSWDPNDKRGIVGYDSTKGFIQDDSPFLYTIRFENIDSATASAENIIVRDTLDQDLDITTLNLESVSHPTYLTTSVDPTDRVITWNFTGINLPPNVNPPEGEGWCKFSISPKINLPSGTIINNSAEIIFDYNDPIITNVFTNTIDNLPPASTILPLPDTISTGEFNVRWTGSDDALGSGISSYNVYVSYDYGAFNIWLAGTTDTSALFVGESERIHSFYCVATDNVGLRENKSPVAETTTLVTGVASPILFLPLYNSYINNPTPKFEWSRSAGQQGSYVLQISTDSLFTDTLWTSESLIDTFYIMPNSFPLNDGSYYWRIKAIGRLGNESGFERKSKFAVDTQAPIAPILIAPNNNSTLSDSAITFIWSSSYGDGVLFNLDFSSNSQFNQIVYSRIIPDTILVVPTNVFLNAGSYFWRVRSADRAKNWSVYQSSPFGFTITDIKDLNPIPSVYSLEYNYPNPFNPVTTIKYQLPQDSRITIKIYDILGQLVITLKDGIEQAGYKSVTWKANNFASGVYFYRLEAVSLADQKNTFTQVKKMILLK